MHVAIFYRTETSSGQPNVKSTSLYAQTDPQTDRDSSTIWLGGVCWHGNVLCLQFVQVELVASVVDVDAD